MPITVHNTYADGLQLATIYQSWNAAAAGSTQENTLRNHFLICWFPMTPLLKNIVCQLRSQHAGKMHFSQISYHGKCRRLFKLLK
jgi:hypothetical protein